MKALTICQPYAHLICLPETDPRHKRIENRTWPTPHRGPLAIHAGKSRDWLEIEDDGNGTEWDANYELEVRALDFGAVIAIAKLVLCASVESIHAGKYDDIHPWAKQHQHANGPWCFVLDDVRRLPKPLPWRGAQGFFEVPDAALVTA
jgi:hypothetical protein